jgi:hypothetical protein
MESSSGGVETRKRLLLLLLSDRNNDIFRAAQITAAFAYCISPSQWSVLVDRYHKRLVNLSKRAAEQVKEHQQNPSNVVLCDG